MDEFAIIKETFRPLAGGDENARGFIDDVAFIPKAKNQIIINTDTIVEGTHFLKTNSFSDIGFKLVMANVSDIIAKGCKPIAGFLNLTLPRNMQVNDIKELATGIQSAKANYGDFPILGGDTTSTDGNLVLSMTLLGEAVGDNIPSRSETKNGDIVYVTGNIGDAKIGLEVLTQQLANINNQYDECINHYNRPKVPKLEIAQIISKYANASMDISDGLLGDFNKILAASNKGGMINLDVIPLSIGARQYLSSSNYKDGLIALASFGDDYQTLFTACTNYNDAIMADALTYGIKVTKIGIIDNSGTLNIQLNNHYIEHNYKLSYSHSLGQ